MMDRITRIATLLGLCSFVPSSSTLLAQEVEAKNALYAEAFGAGFLYSANYERSMAHFASVRTGFSVFSYSYYNGRSTVIVVPVLANLLLGKHASRLEIGLGAEYIRTLDKTHGDFHPSVVRTSIASNFLFVGSFGYRHQPPEGGFLFRLVATPFMSIDGETLFLSGGISAGYCF